MSNRDCYRCGRNTHYANKCYARTHKDGSTLDPNTAKGSRPQR